MLVRVFVLLVVGVVLAFCSLPTMYRLLDG